jgi:hypothetical protein
MKKRAKKMNFVNKFLHKIVKPKTTTRNFIFQKRAWEK